VTRPEAGVTCWAEWTGGGRYGWPLMGGYVAFCGEPKSSKTETGTSFPGGLAGGWQYSTWCSEAGVEERDSGACLGLDQATACSAAIILK
jgi:hypothetical protein